MDKTGQFKHIFIRKILLISLPLFLFSDNYSLSLMEKKSIQMAKKWINNNSKIKRQKDGSLAFNYGDNMPSLICKPLTATVIKLEKGETLKDIKSGDSERWKFDKVENAVNDRTFVLVKPTKANIMTNLILFTNKRIYNIKLVSTANTWTPSISFIYESEANGESDKKSFFSAVEKEKPKMHKKPIKKEVKPLASRSKYVIKSNGSWKPESVFTKKGKTYIHVDDKNIDNIRLYLMNKNISKTIKYSYKNKYLVVNAIIKEAILVKDEFGKTIINIRRR